MAVTLEKELEAFRRNLPGLIRSGKRGQYALVQGDTIHSVWDTREKALDIGYKTFGLKSFLVKAIVEREDPVYFSRNVKRWHS